MEQKNNTSTDKRKLHWGIIVAFVVVVVSLVGGCIYLAHELSQQKIQNDELQQLAELDKKEMEDQYKQFDIQYGELQKQIRNDSLMHEVDKERARAQELLEELQRTKATDAREITRLKKEIATLRTILRSYIVQVDSLNQANEALRSENSAIRTRMSETNNQLSAVSSERNVLKDKVDRAAQLDATGFWVTPKNKRGKSEDKSSKVRRLAFGFTVVKNVTAQGGQRTVYARILKPDNSVYKPQGSFSYENAQVEYSERKMVEYTGEELKVTMYSDVTEFLDAGTYKLFVFVDHQMIGQTSFTLK